MSLLLNLVSWIDLPFFCLCSVSPLLRRHLDVFLVALDGTAAAHMLCMYSMCYFLETPESSYSREYPAAAVQPAQVTSAQR